MALATDPVIRAAIKIRNRLVDCAKEFRIHGRMARKPAGVEMAEHDAKACDEAAAMLQKLGTEVTRLRLSIQHFNAGRMSRFELSEVVKNWNDSPADQTAIPTPTPEQQTAIDAYWAAKTPIEERDAYRRMMQLGLPDSYR
jgi:hypothetical protein